MRPARHLHLVEMRTPLVTRPGFVGLVIAAGFALVAGAGLVALVLEWWR